MALIDSLKNFYKDNVDDINKLNDADSVLEVLRAKYGDYKGSNIEEYIKELVNNDITPSGSTPTGTINITENGEGIDVSSYAYADVNVSGGGSSSVPEFKLTSSVWSCDTTYSAMASMIASSTYKSSTGETLENAIPVAVTYAEEEELVTSFQSAMILQDGTGDFIDAGMVYYHPDGTIEEL